MLRDLLGEVADPVLLARHDGQCDRSEVPHHDLLLSVDVTKRIGVPGRKEREL